jgi:hypothetical protein
MPGGTGNFTGVSVALSADGANVAFAGMGAGGGVAGYYALLDGALERIVDRTTLAPDGSFFNDFSIGVAISGRSVLFGAATSATATSMYVWRDGAISRVIGWGDHLGTGDVLSFFIGPESIDGDTVAFSVRYTDQTTWALYTATIPAPASLALLAGGGLCAARRRRGG